MRQLHFVFFDVGGVLIRDFSGTSKWDELLTDLGLSEGQKEALMRVYYERNDELCTTLPADAFMQEVAKDLEIELTDSYSLQRDILSRFEPNPSIQNAINSISSAYKTGLLTDMFPGMLSEIKQAGIFPDITPDIVVDSSEVGYRKPQPGIYEVAESKVMEAYGKIDPSTILFIDNKQENLDGAAKRGWQTLLYDPTDLEGSNTGLERYINCAN